MRVLVWTFIIASWLLANTIPSKAESKIQLDSSADNVALGIQRLNLAGSGVLPIFHGFNGGKFSIEFTNLKNSSVDLRIYNLKGERVLLVPQISGYHQVAERLIFGKGFYVSVDQSGSTEPSDYNFKMVVEVLGFESGTPGSGSEAVAVRKTPTWFKSEQISSSSLTESQKKNSRGLKTRCC